MGQKRYPLKLKNKILEEYTPHVVGYKQLAREYSLKRDTVRDWVRAKRQKEARLAAKAQKAEEEAKLAAEAEAAAATEAAPQTTEAAGTETATE